ncbi:beta-propeller fold lactonase family protein [Streptomyces sp. NPDC021749]|uniref:beta-propeller fold lactonase family protein n=1 Tax=Streptomyces sp. NPDC021749 TaxID=3154905 RepID=UPI0033DF2920
MTDQSTPPTLSFEIDNAGVTSTVYVTDDASVNDITLTISSTATGPTVFTPAATVVDKSQAGTATGSLLYLDLTPLNLTDREFSAISPPAADWTIVPFPVKRILGMTPKEKLSMEPGGALVKIKIGPLAAAHAPGSSASLLMTVYRVTPVTLKNLPLPTHFGVTLATPPSEGEQLSQDLMPALVTPDVVNSVTGYDTVANQLAFAFYAGPRGRPVTPTADTQFNLSFVYATDPSGYGALCTPDQARQVRVSAGTNAAGWTLTPNPSQQNPSWTLRPPTTRPIISTGPRATVGFLADNLVTRFQAGPTVALISYSDLPGYADGVFTVLITKHAHVSIDSLTVTPHPAVLSNGKAKVTIAWTAQNAGTMTLAPWHVDVTGKTSYTGTITDTTPISLTAQGTCLANMGNIALANTTAHVLPVINSFVAQPSAVYARDLPRDVALSWNVNTAGPLQLRSSTGPPDPAHYAAAGTVTKPVTEPKMFTLLPLGQSGSPTVERSIVVSAFTPQVQAWPVNTARYLAAPPNASYVLVSDGDSQVVAVDTMIYQPVSDNLRVGSKPTGMVFSADGTMLYVANSGSGTVSALSVAHVDGTPNYSFTETATIRVGGTPQQVALSPDGSYLYVTVDKGTQPGQLFVLSTGKTLEVISALPVGPAPRGVAVLPSGARVFVANYSADRTVSVIGRAPDGTHQLGQPVTGVGPAQDVAVTTDGNVLLVTCPATNSVTAINAVQPEARRKVLTVGPAPQQLAILPTGAYAVATSKNSNFVSLLAVGGTPDQCKVLEPGIDVGSGTSAVAVTPDSGLVLLGGTAGFLVATLAQYEPSPSEKLPDIGGQPTNVTVSPDGRTVLGWHNALMTFNLGRPSNGLFAYDIASETVTQRLPGTNVADLAYHPAAADKALFLIDDSHPAVHLVNTDSWTIKDSIDLTAQTIGRPVALAVSGDGSTLFVLVKVKNKQAQSVQLAVYRHQDSPPGWDPLGTATVLSTVEEGSVLTLTAAPNGAQAYITDEGSGNLLVVARDGTGTYALSGRPLPVGHYPSATALSPDGSRLYVACGEADYGSLAEIQTATLTMRSVVLPANGRTALAGLAVMPDGSRLLATDQITAGLRIFDTTSLRLVQTIRWSKGVRMPWGVAVTPDASQIFTANTRSGSLGVIRQTQACPGATGGAVLLSSSSGAGGDTYQRLSSSSGTGGDTYQGLFIRKHVGQTPDSAQTGTWTGCPDIWPSGQQYLPDPAETLVRGYGNDSPVTIFTSKEGANNYIYVRGLNTVNGPHKARVWLYYVNGNGNASLMLWPKNWSTKGLSALQTGHGYIDVTSSLHNEINFTYPPFVWDAVPVTGHYCVIAWVENSPVEPPTDPRDIIGSISSMDELAAFALKHPNMGWKNTCEVPTKMGETWQKKMSLEGPAKGGLFTVGLAFTNMPADAYFAFSILGPEPGKSVNVPKTPIPPNGDYYIKLNWTGFSEYKTNVVVTYWAGQTLLPQGATIEVGVATLSKELVGRIRDPLAGAFLGQVYETGKKKDGCQQEWLTLAGVVQLNLHQM